jgi:uncharacterized protein (TIGR00251 family)
MKITVYMRPGAREGRVEDLGEGNFKVWVKARPEKGKANAEMIEVLAEHFDVAKSAVQIVIGKTAREKLVNIDQV